MPVFVSGADERLEQRMRLQRLRLELRMELAAEEMRMSGELDDLDVGAVGRGPGDAQARRGQRLFVLAVEFVAVAVAFADLGLSIDLVGERAGLELAGPRPRRMVPPSSSTPRNSRSL